MLPKNNTGSDINGFANGQPVFRIEREIGYSIQQLNILFEQYRKEYGFHSDPQGLKSFLKDRVYFRDSTIYIAYAADKAVGFVQLYRFYAVLDLKQQWILNDLYVVPGFRHRGIARSLLHRAFELADRSKSGKIIVQIPAGHRNAVSFCNKIGLQKDKGSDYYQYSQ